MRWWRGLQPNSRGALVALAVVLALHVGLRLGGDDGLSRGTLAGIVTAAAVLVVYSEYSAERGG